MAVSLRRKITRRLMLVFIGVASVQLLLFVAWHLYYYWGRLDAFRAELPTFSILLGVNLLALPLLMGTTLYLIAKILRPLRDMCERAERIDAGELELRLHEHTGATELNTLAETINLAFDRYLGMLKQSKRFSSDASHQLRTPLTAIRTRAEVCLQQAREPAHYEETLGRILEQTDGLQNTVEQLLLLSQLSERAEEAFEPVHPDRLATWIKERFADVAAHRDIELTVDIAPNAPAIDGNLVLLQEALANLIDNAMKATPAGGRVGFSASRIGLQESEWLVTDTGVGIREEDRQRVLQRFQRAEGASYEGQGLGLAIVQSIVDLHDGTLDLQGTTQGTRVQLRFESFG